jgi:DNA-binding NarL/FixJ family response regulator
MPEVLRVAVLSPQHVVRAGLIATLLRHPERFSVVRPPDGPEHEDPDIVLYDVIALLEDDKELSYLVERTFSKILAVGRDLRPDLVARALKAGANGFFDLGVSEAELVEAVESAATGWSQGDSGEDPTVGSISSASGRAALGEDVGLTQQELRVLAGIARGLSNLQIAAEMYLSINSVKTYVRQTYRKIGVSSRSQAVAWALHRGFEAGDG